MPNASVVLTIGGVVHTAALPLAPSPDRWLTGPLVYEGRSVVVPVSSANGAPHPFLRVIFDTRTYADGNGRVDVTVENVLDSWDAITVTYDASIMVNGVKVYDHPAVEHYYLTRWRKAFPFGAGLWSAVRPDLTPFNVSRALPPYLSLVTDRVDSPTMPQFDILHEGALTQDMSSHSGRAELAPFPDWTARYLVNRNPAQLQYVLANGDLSGSWPVHVREPEGGSFAGVGAGRLVSLNQRPLLWYDERAMFDFMQDGVQLPPGVTDENGTPITVANSTPLDFVKGFPMPMREYTEAIPSDGQSPLTPDNAHQPSLAYVPYLLTGDRYYADEMAFWANYGMLRTYPADGTRSDLGVLDNNEVRGYGWALRNIADAAAYSPEPAVAAYFGAKVNGNLQWLDGLAHAATNPLHMLWAGKRPEVGFISLWEQTYLAYAIDRANQQGFAGGLDHRNAIANLQLKLFTDPVWPREQPAGTAWAAPYLLAAGNPGACSFEGQSFECWDTFSFFNTLAEVEAATVGQDWLQRDYAGFYGPEARLDLMMLIASGSNAAVEPYNYLLPFIAERPVGCANTTLGDRVDLDCRPGWALDFYPAAAAPAANAAPTFTPPADITTTASSAAGAVVEFIASGTDNEDGSIAAVCDPASGSTFGFGTRTVNCTVTDSGSLSASGSFTVTVLDAPPAFAAPANVTTTATSAAGAVVTYTSPTATDFKDGVLAVTCLPASGSTFPFGSATVTCSAKNAANMTTTRTFTVTVNDAPPSFAAPGNITLMATTASGAVANYVVPTATDLKDGTVGVACSPASGSTFPIGVTTVNCTATNSSVMTTTRSFTVTINDAPPAFTAPANITVSTSNAGGTAVTYTKPTATDFKDGTLPVTCSPASGATFAVGTTTVSCSATNSSSATTTRTFTVTVTLVAPPPSTTPTGNNVTVNPTGTSTITFSKVTTAGVTSVSALAVSALPPVADGFTIFEQNLAFDVSTTAVFTGNITVCFTVPSVTDASVFASLRLLHAEGGVMVDRTILSPAAPAPNFTTKAICASVSSLSPFAIGVAFNKLSKFVAFSIDSTWLESNTTVVSGDVGANTRNPRRHWHDSDNDDNDPGKVTVRIGERVTMQQAGSRVLGDNIRLEDRASVYNVVSNDLSARRATILGTRTTTLAVPYLTLPAMHDATPGRTAVEVAKGKTTTLAAGAYARVHVSKDATLILTGGLYQMRSLDVDQSATVIFRAATELRIEGELDTDNKAKMILDPNAWMLKASDVVIYVEGDDSACGHDGWDW
ncbi:MAG TPA: HYR domain-containing protein, partial [Vicinamibacterales bacterium]|nr:HYR domain-containing protein [Vicinamibacterales bacterium]